MTPTIGEWMVVETWSHYYEVRQVVQVTPQCAFGADGFRKRRYDLGKVLFSGPATAANAVAAAISASLSTCDAEQRQCTERHEARIQAIIAGAI